MQNEKQVYPGFDILKFICSILIIFLHINPFTGGIRYFSRAIANIGVPCFFIISGFLFFEKLENTDKQRLVLVQYVKRMLILLCFWIVPYFFISDIFWIIRGNIFENIIEYIKHILFGGSGFFLWYIVSSIVAVLIVYAIKDINAMIRHCVMLFLFLIGTIFTSYTHIIKVQWIISFINSYKNIFCTFRNGVFFGAPCVYIGMLMQQKKEYLSSSYLAYGTLCIALVCFIAESGYLFIKDISFSVMQISTTLLSMACVMVFYNVNCNSSKLTFYLRKLSFLIYVIHPLYIKLIPLFLRFLRGIDYYWYLFYAAQVPVVAVASIITGMLLIELANKKTFFRKIM